MDQTTSCDDRQGVSHILCNTSVRCRVRKSSPFYPLLTQINSVEPVSWRSLFNIVFPFAPAPCKWSLTVRFPHQNPLRALSFSHSCYIPFVAHLITRPIFGEQFTGWPSSYTTDINRVVVLSLTQRNADNLHSVVMSPITFATRMRGKHKSYLKHYSLPPHLSLSTGRHLLSVSLIKSFSV